MHRITPRFVSTPYKNAMSGMSGMSPHPTSAVFLGFLNVPPDIPLLFKTVHRRRLPLPTATAVVSGSQDRVRERTYHLHQLLTIDGALPRSLWRRPSPACHYGAGCRPAAAPTRADASRRRAARYPAVSVDSRPPERFPRSLPPRSVRPGRRV